MNNYDGLFVTLEGIDRSGKSTLAKKLKGEYTSATFTREPSDGYYGQILRESIADPDSPPNGLPDFFLFLADRADHIREVIYPNLAAGQTVFCDRYYDSSLAYQTQSFGELVPKHINGVQFADKLLEDWVIEPDLTLYIDIPVEEAIDRMENSSYQKYETRRQLSDARNIYRTLSSVYSDRYETINGMQTREEVFDEAVEIIEDYK